MKSAERSVGRRKAGLALALTTALGATLLAPPAGAAVIDEGGFAEVIDFEGYTAGGLNGQDGWAASAGATVVADPVDAENQVLEMTGELLTASRAIPEIEEGDTGTLFFRFWREGNVNTSVGLTDVDNPSAFPDSRAYVNSQNSQTLSVRNGNVFTPVGIWPEDVWQCVWVVADNEADEVAVYSRGGPYEETTRLPEDGEDQLFDFRTDTAGALDRFFTINDFTSGSRLAIDDIAIDTASENLSVPSGDTEDCEFVEVQEPLQNPLPDPTPSVLGIEVEEFVQLPESSTTPAASDQRLIRHNRITHLDEVPDGSGRLMVPDMNGVLYLIDKESGEYVEYLNVRDAFIDNFHNHAGLGTGFGFAEFHPEFAENGILYTVHTEAGSALTEDVPDFPAFGGAAFHSVVTEWTATDPAAETFAGTSREMMRIPFAGRVHTVQQIAFNPTAEEADEDHGLLYMLVGDGGNGVGNDCEYQSIAFGRV